MPSATDNPRGLSCQPPQGAGQHRGQDLRPIYTAANAEAAELERFDEQWGQRYSMITASWHEHWQHIIPFLALPGELRKAVYTANTIEAMHRQVRKAIKTRGHFPDDQAATKLIYLAITRTEAKWQKNRAWTAARAGLKIHFGDRFPADTTNVTRPHTQKNGQPRPSHGYTLTGSRSPLRRRPRLA
jgi:transposase-like protein